MGEELENKEFDKIVQQKFAGHKVSPPEKLFAQIEKEAALMESNELRNRVVWYRWIIIGLFLLFTSTLIYTLWSPNTAEQNQTTSSKTVSNETENTEKQEQLEQTEEPIINNEQEVNVQNETVLEPGSSSELNSIKSQKEVALKLNSNANVDQNKTTINSSIANADNKEQKSNHRTNATKDDSYENSTRNPVTIEVNKVNSLANNQSSDKDEDNEVGQTPENNTDATGQEQEKSIDEVKETKPEMSSEDNDIEEAVISTDHPIEPTQKDDEAKEQKTSDIESTQEPTVKEEEVLNENSDSEPTDSVAQENTESDSLLVDEKEKKIDKDSNSVSTGKFTVALFFVPNFTNIGLSTSTNEALYTGTNSSKTGVSVAVGVGYQFKPKWTLNLGITHHNFKSENTIENQRPKDLPLLLDPPNSTITVYSAFGTAVITNIGNFQYHGDDQDDIDLDDEDDFASLNYSESQQFTMLDIPLIVGYELGNKKLRGIIQAGLLTSIVIKDKTEVSVNNIYQQGVFATTSDFESNKKINFGLSFSVGVKYGISNRFALLVLPGINRGLMNMSSAHNVTVKPGSIDLRTGLQYNF